MSEAIALIILGTGLITQLAMRWAAPESSSETRLLVRDSSSEVVAADAEPVAESASGGQVDV